MRTRLSILALAMAACGGSPQPGDPGYSFNLEGAYGLEIVADDGSFYAGSVEVATLPGGEVTGTMAISDPMTINGGWSGLIIGAEASLEMTFAIPDAGCSGSAEGSAVIDNGGVGASGSLTVTEDDCDAPATMTFTLTRAAG